MKKIFLSLLIVVFSANVALARPNNNHKPNYNHNKRPQVVHHVVKQKKPHRDTVLAVGAISGLLGFAIGNQVSSNSGSSNIQIIDNTPSYPSGGYYSVTESPASYCETTYNYGRKITRCYNQPQVREIVYF